MSATPPHGSTIEQLAARLKDPINITVLVAAGCPNCPHMVSAVSQLAEEIPLVHMDVVDASEAPELADRYQVRSVPTTVVNEELTIIGVVSLEELARRIVESLSPAGEDSVFKSLVASGRITDATAKLVNGRGIGAFAELWNSSMLEQRIGLSLVAQNAIDEKPDALDSLVELILPSLESEDGARRGDTADLLGAIGHETARAALEKLVEDSNEDIAEAAQDALASIDERTSAGDSL